MHPGGLYWKGVIVGFILVEYLLMPSYRSAKNFPDSVRRAVAVNAVRTAFVVHIKE